MDFDVEPYKKNDGHEVQNSLVKLTLDNPTK
jgi:hypothetical protein